MSHISRSTVLVAVAGGVLSTLATARVVSAQTAEVPSDLAIAYVRSLTPNDSGNQPIEFASGPVAARFQDRVHLPSDIRPIGSVLHGHTLTVIGTTMLSPDSALAHIAREYGRAGWEGLSRATITAGINPNGGFRPAPPTTLSDFCHNDIEVTSSANRQVDGSTLVRLNATERSALCSRLPARPAAPRPPAPTGPLPLLRDPAGTSIRPECFVNAGTQRTQTQYVTTMSPSDMLDHYDKQMVAQGWTREPDTQSARGVWTRRDSGGAVEVATLDARVTPTSSGCRDAALEVMTIRER